MAKFILTNSGWTDLGTLPASFRNDTPYQILYIISTSPPISVNATPSGEILTEEVSLTGAVNTHLYARVAGDRGVYLLRDGDMITAELTDYIQVPAGLTMEEAIEAFKEALATISVLDITDPVPTFASGNTGTTAPYIGFKGERGSSDIFWVWDESEDKMVAYLSADELANKTLAPIKASVFHGALQGNASSATKLFSNRTIEIIGDGAGEVLFDGSGDVQLELDITPSGVIAGTYNKVMVGLDGRVVQGLALAAGDITAALGYVPYGVQDATDANTPNKLVLRDGLGNFSGNAIFAAQFIGPVVGNATSADKFSSPMNLALSGDALGNIDLDGSAPAILPVTLANTAVSPGAYGHITVDSKGRVTFLRNLNSGDITTALTYTPLNKAGDTLNGNLIITGDLQVLGDTVTINTSEILVEDAIITVAKDNSAASLPYGGIKMERGGTDVFWVWEESSDRLIAYTSTDDLAVNRVLTDIQAATFYGNLTGTASNASQATKLTTARNINTVPFDGTADISFGTDKVAEHASARYFTEARVRASLSASSGISFNSTTGEFTLTAGTAPVTSVAGRTGAVVLDIADITNLQTELDKRPPMRVSPTALSNGATIPTTSNGVMYSMTPGTATLITANLPSITGLTDGWHCFIYCGPGVSSYNKTHVLAQNSKSIKYRNSNSSPFVMLGNGEVFRFTWFASLDVWVAECVVQPTPVSLNRWYNGAGAWNSGPTSNTGLFYNQIGGDTTAFDASASNFTRFPCTGVWYQHYGTQFSAAAGGGVTGTAYLYASNTASLSANSSYCIDYATLTVSEDSRFFRVNWCVVTGFAQIAGALMLTSSSGIYYYPDNNQGNIYLMER